jgi:hypothetical protein
MKIKCIYNTGEILRDYTRKPIGVSDITQYGALEIGEEYLVMGMILIEGYLSYLLDSGRSIGTYPCQLFEVTENMLNSNWHFKSYTAHHKNYINKEAVWGYYELCFIEDHYDQLMDMNQEAIAIYIKRKKESYNQDL